MANNTPLSGLSDAAGGILLQPEQAGLLTNGVLNEYNALSIAGDARATNSRQNAFQIWNGTPTAEFVGEGGTKPVTGAEFAGGTLNIKKIATIVTFTDEMIEDVQNGDFNVLVDSGIRTAISDKIDEHVVGRAAGSDVTTSFDTTLRTTTQLVEFDQSKQDGFQLAVSAAMGSLEANGYGRDMGIIHPADVARYVRDARATGGGTVATAQANPLYGGVTDPFYGLPRVTSSNLDNVTSAPGSGKVVGYVVARPNLHARLRHDVRVTPSNEATIGGTSLYQNDLTALRYVTRIGFWVHDLNRAVVKIVNAS
jgi:hypothetical protein